MNHASTAASSTRASMSLIRRIPATSGTVSMSKTRSGVIVGAGSSVTRYRRAAETRARGDTRNRARAEKRIRGPAASRRKHDGRQIPIPAIANHEHDRRVLDRLTHAHCNGARAAGADAAEDAFLAREPPREVLGIGLRDILDLIDARCIEDLRQISGRPFADARDLRAFVGLRADDPDRRISF